MVGRCTKQDPCARCGRYFAARAGLGFGVLVDRIRALELALAAVRDMVPGNAEEQLALARVVARVALAPRGGG